MKLDQGKGLLAQIFAAFLLAIITGVIFGSGMDAVKPLGELFLRLIKFIIVPLVISTLVVGVASTGSIKTLGRMGGKTIIYYLVTTLIAVLIGLIIAYLLKPGSGVDTSAISTGKVPEPSDTGGVVNVFLQIIPTNPVAALTDGNILQIIFFAIFLGVGITMVGERAEPLHRFFDGLAEVMYKITQVVMMLVPIGIFGLLAPIVGNYGLTVLLPLAKLVLAVALGCIIHVGVTYSLSARLLGKMNPLVFFKGISPASLVAFSTQSSSGTLPVTMRCAEESLGVENRVTSFVLPLGATINMDGTSLYIGIATVFAAQVYGIDLSFSQLVMVVLIATLGSIGAAGVPGAGLIMLTLALTTVGLPLEAIALVAGVDRFLDMFRTATNITGDASAALFIQASENNGKSRVAFPQES